MPASLLFNLYNIMSKKPVTITIARGDGIGEEIMDSTLQILEASEAALAFEEIQIGKKVYESGVATGMPAEAWDSLLKNKIFLKAPITTPQGGGYKSLNVTIRKSLGLYANIRPVKSLVPYVESYFHNLDMVIVRENEEDLYAGIEYQQTQGVAQSIKLITREGCERIIRYAFEYARAYGRKKVTCMTKDNIMKQTDGLFHKVFDEVKEEYPDIKTDHFIIDIGAARIADTPQWFDVVVTLNLYGDIISDIAAQVSGSVGLGGSANIGDDFAMFEAIHGSAPDIAGKDIANPSGLISAAAMMLAHTGQPEKAELITNALLTTIEDGIHTKDLESKEYTRELAGTKAFTQAVIKRLGETPRNLKPAVFGEGNGAFNITLKAVPKKKKVLTGTDIFLDWDENERDPEVLGRQIEDLLPEGLSLYNITNRGVAVYPDSQSKTNCSDHWRCRFYSEKGYKHEIEFAQITALLTTLNEAGLDCIKTENLYTFDGQIGYSDGPE